MKQLYSARNGLEAHDVRLFLESQGIKAKVFGDNNALEIGFAFTPASAPGVFVYEADFERAEKLLEEFQSRDKTPIARGSWTCPNCGEPVDSHFDICWNCESPRDDSLMPTSINDQPETDESPRSGRADVEISALKVNGEMVDENGSSDREIWLEVMVVLAVTWLPYFAYSITWWIWPDPPQRTSFMAESIWDLTTNFVDIVVVLYIIHRGHTPWRVHGIKKPRIFVDLSLAFSTWIAMTTVLFLVLRFVVSIVGLEFANAMTTSIHVFDRPSSTADFVVLPFLALSIGVSEELAMRGYLIPRCEQLLGSTPKSILVSSLLFASYHLYQGVGSSMVIFVVGSVFGIAFCWSRRLWPVAIAHAAMDLLALS